MLMAGAMTLGLATGCSSTPTDEGGSSDSGSDSADGGSYKIALIAQLSLIHIYRLCASPTWGIYGYLLSMAFTEMLAFVASFTLLHRRLGFALHPLRRFGVPILCGGALYGWTRVFFTWFEQHSSSETAALVWTAVGAVALYLLVLRLMGIHLWQYLSRRIEKNTLPRLHLL